MTNMNKYQKIMSELGGIQLEDSRPLPLADSEVVLVEETVGHPFLTQYREFFATCSGYHFANYVFFPRPENWWNVTGITVSVFLGIVPIEFHANDIASVQSMMGDSFPSNFLAIANDGGNGWIGIVTSRPMEGVICFWDGGQEVEDPTPIGVEGFCDNNIYHLASSFDNFLERLETEEVYELLVETSKTPDQVISELQCIQRLSANGPYAASGHVTAMADIPRPPNEDDSEANIGFRPTVIVRIGIRKAGKADIATNIAIATDIIAVILSD